MPLVLLHSLFIGVLVFELGQSSLVSRIQPADNLGVLFKRFLSSVLTDVVPSLQLCYCLWRFYLRNVYSQVEPMKRNKEEKMLKRDEE